MVIALVSIIAFATAALVLAAVIFGPKKVTWTDVELMKFSPHQDTVYKCLDFDGEKFLFTLEQVNVARKRAQDLAPHLPRK
jgi:hypothetical protein